MRTPETWRKRSLKTSGIVMSCLVAVLMVASVGGLRWALHAADARSARVMRSRDLLAGVHALARSASVAQAEATAYALTGGPATLAGYGRALAAFDGELAALSSLVADDRTAGVALDRVRELFEIWKREQLALFAYGPATAEFFTPERRDAFLRHLATMEALQVALDRLGATQADAVRAGDRAAIDVTRSIDRATAVASLLVVLVAAGAGSLFSRRVGGPIAELTASAEAIARGELHQRVAVRREDELGSLARSFNTMAERLDQQLRQDEALLQLRELMHAAEDGEEVQRILTLLAPTCMPHTAGRLYLLDPLSERLVPEGGWAIQEGGSPIPARACWAYRLGRPHEVSAAQDNVRCAHAPPGPGTSSLCIPIVAGGSILGVLELSFDGAAPRHVTEVAETLALVLANIRSQDRMRAEAQRDALTGLFNRRHFERALTRELASFADQGGPFALALVDVDHFKRFNDSFGHAAGDAVLRELGALLVRSSRESDVVCRYGGEEFIVLFPGCGLDDAARRSEALRIAAGALTIQHEGRPLPRITVSIGVAACPDHGAEQAQLFAAADAALYRSKAGGRDQVTRAQREPALDSGPA